MERIQREEDSRGVDSDCRAAPTSDGRHDFMRTPIWDECPRGRVDAPHKFAATIGDGVSVAKAQRLWTVVVGL
uniref:OSJNBa0033H08.20 protein n=1 Tax=Oryza sativa subsp. japonica TaxID=39947 RepID=Q7FAC1_ORYSJ|nr:OSJNBa0033H08.20 [Oryza sativa Japonica Group]